MRTEPKPERRMHAPPAAKLLFRGYLIMAFILAMEYIGIIRSPAFIIFLVTIVSVSMVFGVGYLLVRSGPVRLCTHDIPGTALFFVKGIMVLYFVSLLTQFGMLPAGVTKVMMMAIAIVLALAGAFSYLWEVFERSRPLPKPCVVRRTARRPRTR